MRMHSCGKRLTSERGLASSRWLRHLAFVALAFAAALGFRHEAIAHSGELAHWELDEGTGPFALDSSGNANNGTLFSGPAWVAGKLGSALRFDGVDDYVEIPNSPSLNPASVFSITAWVNTTTTSPTQVVVSKYTSNYQYFLRLQGPRVRFAIWAGGSGASLTSTGSITANAWHHIAATYDGAQMRIYIDGVLDSSLAKTGTMVDGGDPVRIGKAGSGMYFAGIIDDVRIHDRGLTAPEVVGGFDSVPPTVSLTAPADGDVVSGVRTVTANASDDVAVLGVRFKLDGANLGSEDTATPYSTPWDTRNTANGQHQLVAEVRDFGGNIRSSSVVTVTVSNVVDLTPPVISLVAATSITTTSATITWTTDEPADSQVEYGATNTYGLSTSIVPTLVIGHSVTLNGLTSGATYHFKVKSRDVSLNPAESTDDVLVTLPPLSDLRAHWKMDEGSGLVTTADASGNGNTGTLLNGPVWVAGKIGSALRFDGVDDYVEAANNATLNPTTALSIVAWVNTTTTTPTQIVVSKYTGNYQYFVRLQGARVRFALTSGGTGASLTSTGSITANSWHQIAATYDGTQMRIYIDGVLDSSLAKTGTMVDGGDPVRIGRAGSGLYFAGIIDDVRIYSRALSATDVSALYGVGSSVDPAASGQWSAPIPWPTVALHVALFHTGEVLSFADGASCNVWSPSTGAFTIAPLTRTNVFCAGHCTLADGRLMVVGGDESILGGNILGEFETNIFDPATRTWTSAASMAYRRWYPSATTLPDGRVLALSGAITFTGVIASIPEVWNPQTDTWSPLNGADLAIPFYPYVFVLPDGRVLDAGADEASVPTRALDVAAQTWTMIDPVAVDGGSAAMYVPGKVLKSGSAATSGEESLVPASANAYVLDMTLPSPTWRKVGSMNNPRLFHTLVLLPDGDVLVTGGARIVTNIDVTKAVLQAEKWSPATETWTPLASMTIPRTYHSTALLLPDGRVLVTGGGVSSGPDQRSAEIYSPPYLFNGARPTIASVASTIQYGNPFTVNTPDAARIAKVSLIRPGAVTHTFDQNQRILSLAFTVSGSSLSVQAPANGNLAPPGYYMLFIVDGNGVPSVAAFVKL